MARACFVFALLLVVAACNAKVWDRCTLAKTLLHKYKIPRWQLDSWMCIAFRESRYTSTHINTINADGSKDYGLFQINNRWWCHNNESPAPNQNSCKVHCDTVLKSMDATVKCIKIMYAKAKNSWEPWITYPYCKKQDMTAFTKGCGI